MSYLLKFGLPAPLLAVVASLGLGSGAFAQASSHDAKVYEHKNH